MENEIHENAEKRATSRRAVKKKFKDQTKRERLQTRKEAYREYFMTLNTAKRIATSLKYIAERHGMTKKELEYWKHKDDWENRAETDIAEGKLQNEIEDNLRDNVPVVKEETIETIQDLLEQADIPDRWKVFVMYYLHSYNIAYAAEKAGYSNPRNCTAGFRALQDSRVKDLISQIKRIMHAEIYITGHDIINEYVKIAFADITEYVEFDGHNVQLRDSSQLDGRLITEVKSGRDGVSIKLADKLKALDRLEKLFDAVPDRRLILDEKKFEFQKELAGSAVGENTQVTIVNDIS